MKLNEFILILGTLTMIIYVIIAVYISLQNHPNYKLDNGVICQSHYDNGSFGNCSDGLIHYNNNAIAINNNNQSQGTDCVTINNKLYCESK